MEDNNNVSNITKRRSWTIAHKLSVCDEADIYGLRDTARKYCMNHSVISRWKKFRTIVAQLDPQEKVVQLNLKRQVGGGAVSTVAARGNDIMEQFDKLRNDFGIGVNYSMMATFCKQKFPEFANVDNDKMYYRMRYFMINNRVVVRCATHVSQNLMNDERVINKFVQSVNNKKAAHKFDHRIVINMDETNLYFENRPNRTLHNKGDKHIGIKTTGNSNRCTILLAVSLAGDKLPPLVIFKGTDNGRIKREVAQLNNLNIKHVVQENGWIDHNILNYWTENILHPYLQNVIGQDTTKTNSYLLMDNCTVHKDKRCLEKLESIGVIVDFIPPHYTGVLQVLDKGVNKPFKDYIRTEYNKFMLARNENIEFALPVELQDDANIANNDIEYNFADFLHFLDEVNINENNNPNEVVEWPEPADPTQMLIGGNDGVFFAPPNVNNKEKISRELMSQWVQIAWDKIKVECITNTWNSIGIR